MHDAPLVEMVRWWCVGCRRDTEQEARPTTLASFALLRCLACGQKDACWWSEVGNTLFRQASA